MACWQFLHATSCRHSSRIRASSQVADAAVHSGGARLPAVRNQEVRCATLHSVAKDDGVADMRHQRAEARHHRMGFRNSKPVRCATLHSVGKHGMGVCISKPVRCASSRSVGNADGRVAREQFDGQSAANTAGACATGGHGLARPLVGHEYDDVAGAQKKMSCQVHAGAYQAMAA